MGCAGSKNAGDAKPKAKAPEDTPATEEVQGEAPVAKEVSFRPD